MKAELSDTAAQLTGALILKAERRGIWMELVTDKGRVFLAGGRVRTDLICDKCREERLVEIVEDARGTQGFCSVCSHSWWITTGAEARAKT